jgi:hypothetical protein
MYEFFEVRDFVVWPSKEILLIPEYAEVWDRDESPKKEVALKEFAFIYFRVSMRKNNPFRAYNEKLKPRKIAERIFKDNPEWRPDDKVKNLVNVYREDVKNSSLTYSYLMSAKIAAEQLKEFFSEEGTLKLRNSRTGAPLYKPKELTSALADTNNILNNLESIERKIDQEELSDSRTKNSREINYFEI